MPGTLYLVGTPIGNLEDASPRALRTLGLVDVIAAEDTRHTRKLLNHFGIATPLVSFHAHSAPPVLKGILARLAHGRSVALVTDAGMPGISDPGAELVTAAREAGATVDVIPGPSALTTALSVSGFAGSPAAFVGFPPRTEVARRRLFRKVASWGCVVVMFESPTRVNRCLSEVYECFGNRQIMVARELTKLHQSIETGLASDLANREFPARGEYVLVIDQNSNGLDVPAGAPDGRMVRIDFDELTKSSGFGRRDAVSELADRYGISSREVYGLLESTKHSGQ